MPKLASLTDYDIVGNPTGTQSEVAVPVSNGLIENVTNKLLGLNGQERYQLWPEKLVREGLAAPHDTLNSEVPVTSQDLIAPAVAMSALAGTGGLAGTTDATLGATPFLRPALKHGQKLYKGKPGQEHADIIPEHLYNDYAKKAISGDDLAEYNFGFMNDKGHFLDREAALKYGIDNGLVKPEAAKFGTLTDDVIKEMSLMADSSKPGAAIEATAKGQPKVKLEKEGNGRFYLKDQNGNELGRLATDYYKGTLNIVNVATKDGANSIGPSAIRDTLSQLLEHYPDATEVAGFRVGGARSGKPDHVTMKFKPVNHTPEFK